MSPFSIMGGREAVSSPDDCSVERWYLGRVVMLLLIGVFHALLLLPSHATRSPPNRPPGAPR